MYLFILERVLVVSLWRGKVNILMSVFCPLTFLVGFGLWIIVWVHGAALYSTVVCLCGCFCFGLESWLIPSYSNASIIWFGGVCLVHTMLQSFSFSSSFDLLEKTENLGIFSHGNIHICWILKKFSVIHVALGFHSCFRSLLFVKTCISYNHLWC